MKSVSKHTIRILVLTLLLVGVIAFGLSNTTARFSTLVSTDKANRTAKWWFVVSYDSTDYSSYATRSFNVNLASTRTDPHASKIKNDRVAPGSYGQIDLTIDCSGCETASVYEISLDYANALLTYPNIIFYTGTEGQASYSEITLGTTVISSTIARDSTTPSNQMATVSLKWKWPVNESLNETEFNGTQFLYSMTISAHQYVSS